MVTISELIKKELGTEKIKISEEDKAKGIRSIGDLTMEQVVKIAKEKLPEIMAKELKSAVKLIVGTAVSMPITIEGKSPKEISREIEEGKWNKVIK